MPKKPIRTATMPLARRKGVFAFVTKRFRESVTTMEKADGAQARYQALSERLRNFELDIRKLDRMADGRLIQAIADGARDVTAALSSFRSSGTEVPKAARLAADGLDRLSDAFLKGAQSLHLLPKKSAKGKKAGLNTRIKRLHAESVELAQEYYLKALAFREAGGIEQPSDKWAFRVPQLTECGGGDECNCAETTVVFPSPIRSPHVPSENTPALSVGKINLERLLLLTRDLDGISRLTATHLKGLVALFALAYFSSSIFCINSCAPVGVVRMSYFFAFNQKGTQGKYYPLIGFRWVLCCACPCYYVLTEQRLEFWDMYGQVTVLDPKATQAEATAEAAKRGPQMANDYNAALSASQAYQQPSDIAPPLQAPTCTCWVA